MAERGSEPRLRVLRHRRVKIRDARAEDAPALAALLAAGLSRRGGAASSSARRLRGRPELLRARRRRVRSPARTGIREHAPLLHEDGSWCRLSALVVDERSRRAGVGRKLVAEIEQRVRAAGCRYLEVTSGERPEREAAHAFYEALGLEQVSRRYLKAL
ncbi:MAG: GNAT family N-acetyltransferase [Gaiellaceae bacterium]